jgi:hypothetical protein
MNVNATEFAHPAAGAVSRRTSLLALAGATLANLASPARAKTGNPARRLRRICRRQGDACREFYDVICPLDAQPEVCFALLPPCCAPLGRCQSGAFFACQKEVRRIRFGGQTASAEPRQSPPRHETIVGIRGA